MNSFNINKITSNKDIIAQELKGARRERRKSIEEVATVLGIRKEYIEALENNQYGKLPQGIYGKNYLREYGRYLKLDEKKLLEMYDECFEAKIKTREKQVFSRSIPKAHLFLIIPRIIKNILLVSLVLVCLLYLGYYINNIIAPPDLAIFYPTQDLTIDKNEVLVSGKTDIEAEITINNVKILADKEGVFMQEVNLRNGINTIIVISKKKYSKQNIKEIKVLVEKQD